MSVLLVLLGVVQVVVLLRILAAVSEYAVVKSDPFGEINNIRRHTIDSMLSAEDSERRQS